MLAGGKSVFLMCPVITAHIAIPIAALQFLIIDTEKQSATHVDCIPYRADKVKRDYIALIRSDFSGNDGLLFIPADLR